VAASWRSIANSQWRGRPEDRTGHALVSAIRLNPTYGMETIFLIEIAWLNWRRLRARPTAVGGSKWQKYL
jgi:hypothetical protein